MKYETEVFIFLGAVKMRFYNVIEATSNFEAMNSARKKALRAFGKYESEFENQEPVINITSRLIRLAS